MQHVNFNLNEEEAKALRAILREWPDFRSQIAQDHMRMDEMHRAIMLPPPGASDEPTLLARMVAVTVMVERSGWATKWTIRIVTTVAGILAAFGMIYATMKGWLQ